MRFRRERATVLRQLAWETFVVGANAGTDGDRMAILRTLCRLAESESGRLSRRTNDGNSARALLSRLVGSTKELRTSYIGEATIVGEELLSQLESGITPMQVLAEAILGVLLSVRVEDSWADGEYFHFSHGVLHPNSDRGKQVVSYCDRLWVIAANADAPGGVRHIAIDLLAKHHQTLNAEQIQADDADRTPDWSFLLRRHLERARSLAATGALDFSLWFSLRDIWEWHANHNDDPELKAIALECEALFRAAPSRNELAALLLDDDVEAAIASTASQLCDRDPAVIAAFFDEGCQFLSVDEHAWRHHKLEALAWEMGRHGMGDNLREYVTKAIQVGSQPVQFSFAMNILGAHLQHLRAAGDDVVLQQEVREAITSSPNDASTADLILRVYQQTYLNAIRNIQPIECDIIAEHLDLFDRNQQLRLLGCMFAVDSTRGRSQAESLLDDTFASNPFELQMALQSFCVGFHPFMLGRKTPPFSQIDYIWILEQIARIPQIPKFSQLGEMDDVIEWYPKFGVQWLAELVTRRFEQLTPLLQRERDVFEHDEAVWILTSEFPFLDLVDPLGEHCSDLDRRAIDRLMELTTAHQSVSYHLWSTVAHLDPAGRVVPELACARLQGPVNATWADVAIWADYASGYPFGSNSWRRIAIAACTIANGFDVDGATRVYSHLTRHRDDGWSGRLGVVHERWFNAVDDAKKLLADETEPMLCKFREWRLMCAERDLQFEQGRKAEERRELHGAHGDD